MRISKIRITNYKCFLDTGEIDLVAGFNFVVGRNDAGKSALLESLSLLIPDKPHRSLVTAPATDDQPHVVSKVDASHELSSVEILSALSKLPIIYVPMNSFVDNEKNLENFNYEMQKDGCLKSQWSSGKIDRGWRGCAEFCVNGVSFKLVSSVLQTEL
ncbi:MAG: AAA family ATPase [Burkholderiaceae bacterium]|nr:AAA family ATPase [Burkholderiaceae bacterium]